MSSRATGGAIRQADDRPRWLISALAGVLASGGLAAGWLVGGLAGVREFGALVGMIVGGVVAGAALGRLRDVVSASVAAGVPLTLIALLVVTSGILHEVAQIVILCVAAGQSLGVLLGGGLGVAAGKKFEFGPVQSAPAIILLALAAGVVTTGWLWFALTLTRT